MTNAAKRYIRFEEIEKKPKTSVFSVVSLSSGESIGFIRWYGPWRQYVFEPHSDTIWNRACLAQVKGFLQKLMDERN